MKEILLNNSPVLTWRWLKVNNIPLKDYNFPEINYDIDSIKENSFIKSRKSFKDEDINNLLDNKFQLKYKEVEHGKIDLAYGVSEEFVLSAEKYFNSGVVIHVKKGEKIEEPIFIDYNLSHEKDKLVDNNIIVAEENSEVTIIVQYGTESDVEAFHNGITKIYAKQGSVVNLVKVQMMNAISKNFDSNVSYVSYGAKVNYVNVELGSKESFSNFVTNLEEENAEGNLKSIYLVDGDRYADLNYIMNHRGRRSLSDMEIRGVLKDTGKKMFKGTLDFKKGSSRAKGSEEEYAILLDPKVKSDAIPLLLCEEDDVEGQHAASAGKIDAEKLFYLMSRGLSEKESKKLIVEASFKPIIDSIPVKELREKIEEEIHRRLVEE
ncbi:Fe-S cluster assembly protein SufD [Hathewaya histolytica]|uniref:FeS assembly protein SufD n=1 Tax=Hathewaya histolytica TaxID=1498 RepID=A0A4V6Z1G4_HATHI|nr:Fe-S cluster assembly protein SufD [Hathewaya histolytica]VTQ95727.1 FeS assembly protein SufD [Hathewaya histolytica]